MHGRFWVFTEDYDKKGDRNLNLYSLQRKYWELVLWLDAAVLQAVHNAFKQASNPGISHKEALITVRRKFVGNDDPIRAEELYHWDPVPTGSQETGS